MGTIVHATSTSDDYCSKVFFVQSATAQKLVVCGFPMFVYFFCSFFCSCSLWVCLEGVHKVCLWPILAGGGRRGDAGDG